MTATIIDPILKLPWYRYFGFFFYAFILGVGLRFIFKAPGLSARDVWEYINANTKEVLKAGCSWLIVFTLWVTAPQWTHLLKWEWASAFNYFYEWRYWSPLVAWLSDSIIGNLLSWGHMALAMLQKLVSKWIESKKPTAGSPPPDSAS